MAEPPKEGQNKRNCSSPVDSGFQSSQDSMRIFSAISGSDHPHMETERRIEKGLCWKDWLKADDKKLVAIGYKEYEPRLLEKLDEKFQGNVMHGLARSSISFTPDELKEIIAQMPKKENLMTEKDIDQDLPVHSALNSLADVDRVSFFVQGTPEQEKCILTSKNEKKKTPIEVAFDNRQKEVVIKLFPLCAKYAELSNLTGIEAKEDCSTLLHNAFDENVWPWFLQTVIEACIANKTDVLAAIQVVDGDGYTPFEYLMNNCFPSPDQDPKIKEFKEVIAFLKEYKIEIDHVCTNSRGSTMLHEARRKNDRRCLAILEPIYDSDVEDKAGKTPDQRDHQFRSSNEGSTPSEDASYSSSAEPFVKSIEATRLTPRIIAWKTWLKDNKDELTKDGVLAKKVYGDLISEVDGNFRGTAMHGLARSCPSFTTEEMKRIVRSMPKEQLYAKDDDGDLPVHSAINSLASGEMVALFVQGDKTKILSTENDKRKTPIELAFDKRNDGAIEVLFRLCVECEILPRLTGYKVCNGGKFSTLLHAAFERDDVIFWSWFLGVVIESLLKHVDQATFKEDLKNAIQVFDECDCTAFYYLMNCMNPKHDNYEFHLSGFKKVIVLLENNEIDLSEICTDSKERTMLHEARRKNDKECSKILIEHGHRENVKDCKGITPEQRDHRIDTFEPKIRSGPTECTEDP